MCPLLAVVAASVVILISHFWLITSSAESSNNLDSIRMTISSSSEVAPTVLVVGSAAIFINGVIRGSVYCLLSASLGIEAGAPPLVTRC